MLHVPVFAAAAASGRFTPPTPTLSHTASGQFTITNYNPTYIYTFTNVSGGGSVTNTAGVLTGMPAISRWSIKATSPKSSVSVLAYMERKQYTTTPTNVDVSYIHTPPSHGIVNYGTNAVPGSRWMYCSDGQTNESQHQEGTQVKNSTPSGYTDQYGEWFKTT